MVHDGRSLNSPGEILDIAARDGILNNTLLSPVSEREVHGPTDGRLSETLDNLNLPRRFRLRRRAAAQLRKSCMLQFQPRCPRYGQRVARHTGAAIAGYLRTCSLRGFKVSGHQWAGWGRSRADPSSNSDEVDDD
ncbi:hypothetical protein ACQR1W_08245 [Bradyrhizobium sp. HKCCYLS1011]|uniref:hypothetical protein n=1 Tax=Bradyrhizobium sp. HKCCYLS1011 TaxID=3420733 RepID=UPI003EBF5ECA